MNELKLESCAFPSQCLRIEPMLHFGVSLSLTQRDVSSAYGLSRNSLTRIYHSSAAVTCEVSVLQNVNCGGWENWLT